LGESLAVWGFRYIFVVSGHGSPKHIVAIESACVKISRKYRIQMHDLFGVLAIKFLRGQFVDRISERLSNPLSPQERELLKSDIHGGWWETSMMLLLHPDLVGEFENLPTIKRGDKGVRLGYFGSPALADKEFAEVSLKVMNEEAENIIEKILDGRNKKSDTVSILYRIPLFRPYSIGTFIYIIMALIILALLAIIIFR
jgi:creatinine amidohydrolase